MSDPDRAAAASDARVYDGRQDDFWGISATVDWRFADYYCVGVGYSHIRNRSSSDESGEALSDSDASYEGNRWILRASFNL
jgi:hypothetical protein